MLGTTTTNRGSEGEGETAQTSSATTERTTCTSTDCTTSELNYGENLCNLFTPTNPALLNDHELPTPSILYGIHNVGSKGSLAKLMRVPIQLGTLKTQAFLDTGAQVSIMAVSVFSKVPRDQVKMIKSPEQCIETITVSGEKLPCIGHYEIPFTLYNKKHCQNVFLIIARLDEGIILGVDFITKFDVIIQPGKRLLSFGVDSSLQLPDDVTPVVADQNPNFPIFQVSISSEENIDRFNLTHLSIDDRKRVGRVLSAYPNIFKQKTIELGIGTTVKHAINIIGPPVFQPIRRLAYKALVISQP